MGSSKKVVILGAGGQVGRCLVALSSEYQYETLAFERVQTDLSVNEQVEELFDRLSPDLVINAAAHTNVAMAEKNPTQAFMINHFAVGNLARLCSQGGCPLFHLSTDYVFDGRKLDSYQESDLVNPLNVYGKSKYLGEESIRTQMKEYLIVRCSWVFSEFRNNFVTNMLSLAVTNDELKIVSDQVGGPTSAKSIARLLLDLADSYFKKNNLTWGTYHFCGTPSVTWLDFAREIFFRSKSYRLLETIPDLFPISGADFDDRVIRPYNSVLSCEKIDQTFGIDQDDWRSSLDGVLSNISKMKK